MVGSDFQLARDTAGSRRIIWGQKWSLHTELLFEFIVLPLVGRVALRHQTGQTDMVQAVLGGAVLVASGL